MFRLLVCYSLLFLASPLLAKEDVVDFKPEGGPLRYDGPGTLRRWEEPVREIGAQREPVKEWKELNYEKGRSEEPLADFKECSYEVEAEAQAVKVVAGGEAVKFDALGTCRIRPVWK